MMYDNIILSLASRRVRAFADDEQRRHETLIQSHEDALACRDCEGFLQLGIEAFKWLRRAEETMREADYEGLFDFDRETQDALDALYEAWIPPCKYAEEWIRILGERGYRPDNLDEFRNAQEGVSEIIEHRDWKSRARTYRAVAEAEEPW